MRFWRRHMHVLVKHTNALLQLSIEASNIPEKDIENNASNEDTYREKGVRDFYSNFIFGEFCHSLRNLNGENLAGFEVKDLQNLENQLQAGVTRVRARKMQLLMEQIQDFRKREVLLFQENELLKSKLLEASSMQAGSVTTENTSQDIQDISSIKSGCGKPRVFYYPMHGDTNWKYVIDVAPCATRVLQSTQELSTIDDVNRILDDNDDDISEKGGSFSDAELEYSSTSMDGSASESEKSFQNAFELDTNTDETDTFSHSSIGLKLEIVLEIGHEDLYADITSVP
ncbi:hypothetical protein L7F22_027852 [Adiantum nelumboides]|nr:hypothetical protein [Adiantum nelumboides]